VSAATPHPVKWFRCQAAERISEELNIPEFTPHDLRRTCATKLGQMQVPSHIIARILNHKQTDITSTVYNQYEYLQEKKEALDSLGSWIVKLASGLEVLEVPSAKA
jgi:integrase